MVLELSAGAIVPVMYAEHMTGEPYVDRLGVQFPSMWLVPLLPISTTETLKPFDGMYIGVPKLL